MKTQIGEMKGEMETKGTMEDNEKSVDKIRAIDYDIVYTIRVPWQDFKNRRDSILQIYDLIQFTDLEMGADRKEAYGYLALNKIPFFKRTEMIHEPVPVCKTHKQKRSDLNDVYRDDNHIRDCFGNMGFYRSTDCKIIWNPTRKTNQIVVKGHGCRFNECSDKYIDSFESERYKNECIDKMMIRLGIYSKISRLILEY